MIGTEWCCKISREGAVSRVGHVPPILYMPLNWQHLASLDAYSRHPEGCELATANSNPKKRKGVMHCHGKWQGSLGL